AAAVDAGAEPVASLSVHFALDRAGDGELHGAWTLQTEGGVLNAAGWSRPAARAEILPRQVDSVREISRIGIQLDHERQDEPRVVVADQDRKWAGCLAKGEDVRPARHRTERLERPLRVDLFVVG